MSLRITIEARLLAQALKSINIRAMEDIVQLQAHAGALILTTNTLPFYSWEQEEPLFMSASCSLTEEVIVREEGGTAVSYRRLVDTLKAYEGPIAVQHKGDDLYVVSVGDSALEQYATVPTTTPAVQRTHSSTEVGSTYTKDRVVEDVSCACCGTKKREVHTDSYRVCSVATERLRIERTRLLTMLRQVKWAVGEDQYPSPRRMGIRVNLSDDTLSLQACDDVGAAVCSELLPGSGTWQQAILVMGKWLLRAVELLPKQGEVVVEATLVEHQHIQRDHTDVAKAVPFWNAKELCLSSGRLQFTLSPLIAPAPDYQPELARVRETSATCATADLLQALRTVESSTLYGGTGRVRLHIGETSIGCAALDFKGTRPAEFNLAYSAKVGPNATVTVPWWHFHDAVKAIPSPEVIVEIGPTENAPEKMHVILRAQANGSQEQCALRAEKITAESER